MKKRLIILGMAVCFIASSAMAAAGSKTVSATFTNLKLYLNGSKITGNVLSYNKVNYIPASTLSTYLGYRVTTGSDKLAITDRTNYKALQEKNAELTAENKELKEKLRLYSAGKEDYTGKSSEDYYNSLTGAASLQTAVWPLVKNKFIKTARGTAADTWYKFALNEGQGLTVVLKAQIDKDAIDLYLYDKEEYQLGYAKVTNDQSGILNYKAADDAVVYLKVTGSTGIYYLGFYDYYSNNEQSEADERDFFGSLYTAKKLACYTYDREEDSLPDYYRIEVKENQLLNVVMIPKLDLGTAELKLYNSEGYVLKTNYIQADKIGYVSIKAPKDNMYYISISGPPGKYYVEYTLKN